MNALPALGADYPVPRFRIVEAVGPDLVRYAVMKHLSYPGAEIAAVLKSLGNGVSIVGSCFPN